MAGEDSNKPQLIRAAIKLSGPSRWAAFILGLAGLVAGGLAAFKAHLEAPPVALLSVGLIFVLIALAGVVPTRIKAGDYEAEFMEQRLATALKQGVDAIPPDARDQVAGLVERVAEVAPQVAAPAQEALDYARMAGRLAAEILREPDMQALRGETAPKRTVIFQPYASTGSVPLSALTSAYSRSLIDGEPNSTVLIISQSPLSAEAVTQLERLPGMYHAMVRGEEDRAGLVLAIRGALTGPAIPENKTRFL